MLYSSSFVFTFEYLFLLSCLWAYFINFIIYNYIIFLITYFYFCTYKIVDLISILLQLLIYIVSNEKHIYFIILNIQYSVISLFTVDENFRLINGSASSELIIRDGDKFENSNNDSTSNLESEKSWTDCIKDVSSPLFHSQYNSEFNSKSPSKRSPNDSNLNNSPLVALTYSNPSSPCSNNKTNVNKFDINYDNNDNNNNDNNKNRHDKNNDNNNNNNNNNNNKIVNSINDEKSLDPPSFCSIHSSPSITRTPPRYSLKEGYAINREDESDFIPLSTEDEIPLETGITEITPSRIASSSSDNKIMKYRKDSSNSQNGGTDEIPSQTGVETSPTLSNGHKKVNQNENENENESHNTDYYQNENKKDQILFERAIAEAGVKSKNKFTDRNADHDIDNNDNNGDNNNDNNNDNDNDDINNSRRSSQNSISIINLSNFNNSFNNSNNNSSCHSTTHSRNNSPNPSIIGGSTKITNTEKSKHLKSLERTHGSRNFLKPSGLCANSKTDDAILPVRLKGKNSNDDINDKRGSKRYEYFLNSPSLKNYININNNNNSNNKNNGSVNVNSTKSEYNENNNNSSYKYMNKNMSKSCDYTNDNTNNNNSFFDVIGLSSSSKSNVHSPADTPPHTSRSDTYNDMKNEKNSFQNSEKTTRRGSFGMKSPNFGSFSFFTKSRTSGSTTPTPSSPAVPVSVSQSNQTIRSLFQRNATTTVSSKSSSFSPKKSNFEEPLELRENEILLKDVGEMKQFENDSVSMNNTTDNDNKGTILLNSVRNKNNFTINHRNMDNSNLQTDYNNQNREINSAEEDTWKEVVTEEETGRGNKLSFSSISYNVDDYDTSSINNKAAKNDDNSNNNDNNNNNNNNNNNRNNSRNNNNNYNNNDNEITRNRNYFHRQFSTTAPTTPRRKEIEIEKPRARAFSFMSIFSPFAFAPLSLSTVFSHSNSDLLYEEHSDYCSQEYSEKRFSKLGLQSSNFGIGEDKISPNVTVRQKRTSTGHTEKSVTDNMSDKKYIRTKASTLEPFSIRKSSSTDENEIGDLKKHLSFSTNNDHVIKRKISRREKNNKGRDDDNDDVIEVIDNNGLSEGDEGADFDSMSDSGDERGSEEGSETGDKDLANNGEAEEHSFPNILFSQTEILGLRLMFSLFDRFV